MIYYLENNSQLWHMKDLIKLKKNYFNSDPLKTKATLQTHARANCCDYSASYAHNKINKTIWTLI